MRPFWYCVFDFSSLGWLTAYKPCCEAELGLEGLKPGVKRVNSQGEIVFSLSIGSLVVSKNQHFP